MCNYNACAVNIVSNVMEYHSNQGYEGWKVWMMRGEEEIPETELADSLACEVGLLNCGRITFSEGID